MGFTSKKMPNNILYNICLKVFQFVKPFLANLHSTLSKKYLYMYSMTPNFFYFFFNIWVSKKRRILRWFQIRWNNLKKAYLEKVIFQKLVQVSSIEEDKFQVCTLLSVTFLLANFLHFSQQIPNQRKILRFLYSYVKKEKKFGVMEYIYEYFFEIHVECKFARNGLTNWKTF